MKTPVAKLAAGTVALLAAGLLLSACSVHTSTFGVEGADAYQYDVRATILSTTDGVRSVVTPGDIGAGAGSTHYVQFAIQADGPTTDTEALRHWKRLLTALLDAPDGLGVGPWCLLSASATSDHVRMHTEAASPATLEGTVELADCPASAVLADLELSRTDVRFGPLGVGFLSAYEPITLTNRGSVPIDIGEPALDRTGQWSEFPLDRGTCAILFLADHLRLAPGAACTFSIAFQPTAGGERAADVRVASYDRPEVTATAHVSGLAQAGVVAVDRDFCVMLDAADGCFRRDLQIINLGPGRVTIESLPANGDWLLGNWRRVDGTGTPVPIPPPPVPDVDPTSASRPTDVFVSVSSCLADPAATTLSLGLGSGEPPISISVTPLTFSGRCTP